MKKSIHIDTYFAERDSATDNPAVRSVSKLSQPIRNVRRVSLSSCELTNSLPNVRTGVNTLTFSYNGSQKTYTIPLADYTDINTLLTAVNTAITSNPLSTGVVLTFSTATDALKVKITGNVSGYRVISSPFATEILGFNNAQIVSGNNITAQVNWNLASDTYIWMKINNFSTGILHTNTSQKHFRIPLPSSYGYFQNLTESTGLIPNQHIDLCSDNIITEIDISLYDKFGNLITTPFNSFSCSLEFTMRDEF